MKLDLKVLEAALKAGGNPFLLREAIQAAFDAADLVERKEIAHYANALSAERDEAREEAAAWKENYNVARKEAEELESDLAYSKNEFELRANLADEQSKQLAALREALENLLKANDPAIGEKWCSPALIETGKQARTALTDTAKAAEGWQRVPEGHVVVPVEPTDEMIKRGMDKQFSSLLDTAESDNEVASDTWHAMLAAAPKAGEGPKDEE